jgi:hypothetical protein
MNGIDILVIVIVLAIVFVGANMLDKHEDKLDEPDIEDELAKARKSRRNGSG